MPGPKRLGRIVREMRIVVVSPEKEFPVPAEIAILLEVKVKPIERASRDDLAADFRHDSGQLLQPLFGLHAVGVFRESPVHAVVAIEHCRADERGSLKSSICEDRRESRYLGVENETSHVPDFVNLRVGSGQDRRVRRSG